MHSSSYLCEALFEVENPRTGAVADMRAVFPDYHGKERIAVVSRVWEEAFSRTAVVVTGFMGMFYGSMRATGAPFFDYPPFFLLIAHRDGKPITRHGPVELAPPLTKSWEFLDIWPESQWLLASMECGDLLNTLLAQHIHRVFVPAELVAPARLVAPFPKQLRWVLATRLKHVHVYGSPTPDCRVRIAAEARELMAKSTAYLGDMPVPETSEFESMSGAAFLERLLGPAPGPPAVADA